MCVRARVCVGEEGGGGSCVGAEMAAVKWGIKEIIFFVDTESWKVSDWRRVASDI